MWKYSVAPEGWTVMVIKWLKLGSVAVTWEPQLQAQRPRDCGVFRGSQGSGHFLWPRCGTGISTNR